MSAHPNFSVTESHIISELKQNSTDFSPIFKELQQVQSQENPAQFKLDLAKLNKDLQDQGLLPTVDIINIDPKSKDGFKIDINPNPTDNTPPPSSDSSSNSSSDSNGPQPWINPNGGGGGGDSGSGGGGGSSGGGGGGGFGGGGGGGDSGGGGGGGGDAPAISGNLPAPIDNGSEIETTSDPKVAQLESSLGNDVGSKAVEAEISQLGTPYVYAAESAGKAFDCSGLTDWAYEKAETGNAASGQRGQSIGATAASQEAYCQSHGNMITDMSQLKPGDLLFYNEGAGSPQHVAMYAGKGMMIEAPHTGERVRLVAMRQPDAAGRPTKA
jgi:cell wall-associated NlpC family hydrolase